MVWFAVADEEPDSFVEVEYVYDKQNNPDKNPDIVFDFKVFYTRAPALNSDGEEEEDTDYANLDTLTICETHEIPKELLFGGDHMEQIEEIEHCRNNVCYVLEYINVPRYREIVSRLTRTILDLKNRETLCVLPKVERVKVVLDVMVWRFPGEEEESVDDVRLAVAPASEEAVEAHLETVVVENDEGVCVICMDEIMVGSDVEVVRMPCLHLFHRNCGAEWLRNSGICPVCRAVFPSES